MSVMQLFQPSATGIMKDQVARYVVSVLTPDRTGLMRGITTAITDLGGDIQGISQTVVQAYFTVILVAEFKSSVTAQSVQMTIVENFPEHSISVMVREFHDHCEASSDSERYILTLMGREAPGILKQLTEYLAEQAINIEDWYFRIDGAMVTHIGEITVPSRLDIRRIQEDLRILLEPRDLRVHCRHENIFRATNELESIGLMLDLQTRDRAKPDRKLKHV